MSTMGTMAPRGNGLRITMTVFGAIGMAVWSTSIGFLLGWEYNDFGAPRVVLVRNVSILIYAGMILVTCRLIFLDMNSQFNKNSGLRDLHRCVAHMVGLTVLGFSTWVTSVVWLAMDDYESYIVYHACNYGFILSTIVAGLGGGLMQVSRKNDALPVPVVPPKFEAQQSQAHYNPAYAHHAYHQRM